MEHSGQPNKVLPANAYTPLQPGEVYQPVVPAKSTLPEVTGRALAYGIVLTIIFAFAAAFIGFKTGNAIETAIPIAILAVFFGKWHARKNSLLENVIIQSMGQASGVVVAGAGFTIPALYINGLEPNLYHAFLACMSGGFLGILLLIPLRRFFVKDMHGQLPFPEATATTEILATGEQSGGSAGKTLLAAFGIGMVFEFLVETMHLWNTSLTTKILKGEFFAKLVKHGVEVRMSAVSATFGLGYIIGLKYAAIIAAGSVLANLILVPLIHQFGPEHAVQVREGGVLVSKLISQLSPSEIWANLVKPIGIGAIAVAGMIGIMKMSKIILGSLTLGFKGLFSSHTSNSQERTDTDISPRVVLLLELVMAAAIFALFHYIFEADLKSSLIGAGIVLLLAFLFTPVAARAIAIVGVNPVSGMTLITVIISCLVLVKYTTLEGTSGQMIAICIGCAVCTALSMSGAFVTDLKVGYWLGSTPRKQEWLKFLAIAIAAASVVAVIAILQEGYGFVTPDGNPNQALPAPQANLIGAITKGLMSSETQPWALYGLGGIMAVMLEMVGVAGLAFALGVYLPMEINLAVLFGGLTSYLVSHSSRKARVRQARKNQGILIASGLMAGAAISGIISAMMRIPQLFSPIRSLSLGQKFLFGDRLQEMAGQLKDQVTPEIGGSLPETLSAENAEFLSNVAPKYLANNFEKIHKMAGDLKGMSEESIASTLNHMEVHWYGEQGMIAGAIMIGVLAITCFILAWRGARADLVAEAAPANDPDDPENLFGGLGQNESEGSADEGEGKE